MIEPAEIVISLLPPALLLISGWWLKNKFFHEIEGDGLSFLVSLLLGTAAFSVPYILVGVTTSLLSLFVGAHAIAVLLLLLTSWKRAIDSLKHFGVLLTAVRPRRGFLAVFSSLSFFFYSCKAIFTCLLGPIVSGDALYFWISMGKVFFNLNNIPVFDPYHLWNYSAEPLSSSLYSWGFFFAGTADLEVFRGISVLFFLALPVLSYEITKTWSGSDRAAQITMVISCFMPILDYMVTIYSFYADAMAVLFACLASLVMRKAIWDRSSKHAFLAGLSVAMSILSKYHIGLLAAFVIVIQLLYFLDRPKGGYAVRGALTLAFALVMIAAGNVMWSFGSSVMALIVLGILAAATAWARSGDSDETPRDWRSLTSILVSLIVGASASLVWGVRTLLQGAAMFGIPFLRLFPVSPEASEVADVISQFTQTVTTAERFTSLSLIGFVFHPLMNGFFSLAILAILVSAARRTRVKSLLWVLLIWYIGYLSVMGYYPSGRHLLPTAVFLGPLLSISLDELAADGRSLWSSLNPILVVVLFATTSLFQMVTSSLAWMDLGFPSIGFVSMVGIPYTTSFGLLTTPELVQRTAVVALVVALLLVSSLFVGRRYDFGKRATNPQVFLFFALILSSTLVIPTAMHAFSVTSGNMLNYDYSGSWNKGDILLADAMADLVDEDEVILAYGDIMLAYRGFRVLDLYHSGLYAVPSLASSENLTLIYLTLWSLGVRFVVLPSNDSYLASSYWVFVSHVSFPELLVSANATVFLMEMSRWRIYQLQDTPSPDS